MDMMEAWKPTLTDLRSTYNKYFTLAYLNVSPENKFALISLICFLTKQARIKNPDATVEQVIQKIKGNDQDNSQELLDAITIICEDYLKDKDAKFPIFGAKSAAEIVDKIKEILMSEMPF